MENRRNGIAETKAQIWTGHKGVPSEGLDLLDLEGYTEATKT